VCPHCLGHGRMRSVESLSLSIIRVAEEHAMKESTAQVLVQAPVEIANYLLNEKRSALTDIEKRHSAPVVIVADEHLTTPHYEVTRLRELGEESSRPSYQRGTPRKLPTIALTKGQVNVPPEAAVTKVQHAQPAPVREVKPVSVPAPKTAAEPAQNMVGKGGVIGWFKRIFGAADETPAPQPAQRQNGRRNNARDGRGGESQRESGRNGQRRNNQRRDQRDSRREDAPAREQVQGARQNQSEAVVKTPSAAQQQQQKKPKSTQQPRKPKPVRQPPAAASVSAPVVAVQEVNVQEVNAQAPAAASVVVAAPITPVAADTTARPITVPASVADFPPVTVLPERPASSSLAAQYPAAIPGAPVEIAADTTVALPVATQVEAAPAAVVPMESAATPDAQEPPPSPMTTAETVGPPASTDPALTEDDPSTNRRRRGRRGGRRRRRGGEGASLAMVDGDLLDADVDVDVDEMIVVAASSAQPEFDFDTLPMEPHTAVVSMPAHLDTLPVAAAETAVEAVTEKLG